MNTLSNCCVWSTLSKFSPQWRKRTVFVGLLVSLIWFASSCGFHPPTISTLNRKGTVPIHPKRLVVLRSDLLAYTVALGITPVGAPKNSSSPFVQLEPTQWQKIEETGDALLPTNLERILSLKPDLILGYKGQEEVYPLLSQIAPTILVDFGVSFDQDWQKFFYQVAQILGKKEEASQVVANYQTRLQSLKTRMETRLSSTKVSVIKVIQQRIALYNKVSFGGRILEEIGLSRPPSQTLDAQTALRRSGFTIADVVSWESLSDIDADVIFVISDQIGSSHSPLAQLRTQPLWSRLKVVQRGRVYEVGYYWYGYGPIAANKVLDDLEKYILKPPHPTL